MRLSISVGVPWNIFDIQGWLMPEKCILEAFGTGVPARKVTVKDVEYDLKTPEFR